MQIINSAQTAQETCLRWKAAGESIALVPTMGCLHQGHLALVKHAKTLGRRIVVSIFVNPLQFGPKEDFSKYPRTFEEDKAKLSDFGVDLIFCPAVKDLYPDAFSANISLGDITKRLCGEFRPGHFEGVATVCMKLFQISQSDYAVFGEKDFQQLRIIQQMAADLNLPISIVSHPTVRDSDGLAMSSRNLYLSPEERNWALQIPRALKLAREAALQDGTLKVSDILNLVQIELSKSPLKVQYVTITTLRSLVPAGPEAYVNAVSLPHLFIAAFAGTTRLIDNISLNGNHT